MIHKCLICHLLLSFLFIPTHWSQERAIRPLETNNRQALVIGNANYEHAGVLRNPANDAQAIGDTLEELGFRVTTLTEANKRQMDQAIRKFGKDLRNSNGVGLFYYAGHGMQIDGENYLLPTDINPSNETDVSYDAVPVGKLLGQMKDAGNGMNVVILDACRNNPFARSFRSGSRGLAQVIAPAGSFISYATAPGDVAADGEGDNGLFTEKLLQHMTTPGLRLEEVFKRVRADVQQDSNNKQVPWDSSSVTGDFFFVPMAEVAPAMPTAISSGTTPEQDIAVQAWELIKDTEDPRAFETFIQMFPEAPQSNLAKLKLITLAPKEPKVDSSVSKVESPIPETPKVNLAVPKNMEVLSGEAAIKKLLATKECVGCDLREVNLRKADLTQAILRGVDLEGANLFYANLTGANLISAKLTKANLRRAIFCNTTMPDGSINNSNCDSNSSKASSSLPEKADRKIPESGMAPSTYQKIGQNSSDAIGCGFFHIGCLETGLSFPAFQSDFHIKGYRRVHVWGKERTWQNTGLSVGARDRIYLLGTGEVTVCQNCLFSGPRQLHQGILSYKIGENKPDGYIPAVESNPYTGRIDAWFQGTLFLAVHDGHSVASVNKGGPTFKNFGDTSGVYILDIFVIDPDQEEGFNLFKDAILKANPNDSNAKAYLGR